MNQRVVRRAHAIAALAVAGTIIAACNEGPSRTPDVMAYGGPVSRWVGCEAGGKYTGGGRVDPIDVGKVTFGFNVHAGDCDGTNIKGQIQVVYHETQTLVHSLSIDHFASFHDPERGDCGEFDGTARVKHVNAGSDWHEHHYTAVVCDAGEPGRDDRFTFTLDGERGLHENFFDEKLTGGNIQAHKS